MAAGGEGAERAGLGAEGLSRPLPSSLWKLDLCTTVLPQIEKLLQSKYERYAESCRRLMAGRTGQIPRWGPQGCLCSRAAPLQPPAASKGPGGNEPACLSSSAPLSVCLSLLFACLRLRPSTCLCSYVQTGCTSLKLILQRFLPLITDILAAPPSVGVDISREER